MKIIRFIVLSFLIASCSELIDKPKNLLPKDQMSELIVEFAEADQLNNYISGTNMDNATRFILRKNKIKAADFTESYKYYMASGELDKILSNAQEIILDKDPQSAEFIEKKNKENINLESVER